MDDPLVLGLLGVGVLVLVLIIVFGVLSSRRKARATTASYTTRVISVLNQPVVESSSVELADKRQWELFQQAYSPGTVVDVPAGPGGATRSLTVSRTRRSLRAGWPQAKAGFTAYFAEFDNSEFPISLPVSGSKAARLDATAEGVTVVDGQGTTLWTAPWPQVNFSNGQDLALAGGGKVIHLDVHHSADALSEAEELLIKYGTFKQMHF